MNDLEALLNNIYADIRYRNTDRGKHAVPHSDEFSEYIGKKYSLIPFSIPTLFKMLVDSHKIFQFIIVEADRTEHIRRIEGLVVTEGNIIKSLVENYSDDLIKEFSHEFAQRLTIDKIIKEIVPRTGEFNNRPLGITANIVINLMSFQSILEREIMQYGLKWQERQLKFEIEKSDPISFFLDKGGDVKAAPEKKSVPPPQTTEAAEKHSADHARIKEFRNYSSKESMEKTLAVYGVEFYTRVCFRDSQYSLVLKLVEDGVIKEKEDLLSIKRLIQKERQSSDTNMNLQKYANEINNLEKTINAHLKQVPD
jgi:hypothetical protein